MIEGEHRIPNPSRITNHESRYQRALGQYFTPEPVVALCYRMLRDIDPATTNPTIIDPACREGAFLSHALDHGITPPDRLFGVEKDPAIAETIHLPGTHLFTGDGLSPSNTWHSLHPVSPSPHPPLAFDWVVGNPPFGTRGTIDAERIRADFTIWRGSLPRYPIEILFLERFVQLTRPGGHVAIIVPDGILANARLGYVREWLWAHTEVKAVTSLHAHTFHRHGASAKASVLVLRRREHAGVMERWSGGVLGFQYSRTPLPQYSIPILPQSPSDRLDPAYYDARFVENRRFLESRPDTVPLGDLIEFTTYGAVGSREYSDSGVRYITPANLPLTADGFVAEVDLRHPGRFVPEGSRNDVPRSRLRGGDLLLANSGVGCIGRTAVFDSDEPCNISQHVNLLRFHGIEPEYVAVYLQTRFGRLQIDREKCGVGACGINFDRIRSILIPVLPAEKRREIVEAYRSRTVRPAVERLEDLIRS